MFILITLISLLTLKCTKACELVPPNQPTGQSFTFPNQSTFDIDIIPFTQQGCDASETVIHTGSVNGYGGLSVNHQSSTNLQKLVFNGVIPDQTFRVVVTAVAQISGTSRKDCFQVQVGNGGTGVTNPCQCRKSYSGPPTMPYPNFKIYDTASTTTHTIGTDFLFNLHSSCQDPTVTINYDLELYESLTGSWQVVTNAAQSNAGTFQASSGTIPSPSFYRIRINQISESGAGFINPVNLYSDGTSTFTYCAFQTNYLSAFQSSSQQTTFAIEAYRGTGVPIVSIPLVVYQATTPGCTQADVTQNVTPLPAGFSLQMVGITVQNLNIDFDNANVAHNTYSFQLQATLLGHTESNSFDIHIIDCTSQDLSLPANIWSSNPHGGSNDSTIRFLMNTGTSTLAFAAFGRQHSVCGTLQYQYTITPTQTTPLFLNPNSSPGGPGTISVNTHDHTPASTTFTILLKVQNTHTSSELSQAAVTIHFVNCDDYVPDPLDMTLPSSPPWQYPETHLADKTFTMPQMALPTSHPNQDICPVQIYELDLNSVQKGLDPSSLTTISQIDVLTLFDIDFSVNVRTIMAKRLAFVLNGGFAAKEGIYIFPGKAWMSSTQQTTGTTYQSFQLEIRVTTDCVPASITVNPTVQPDVVYTVHQGQKDVNIQPFTTNSPFSCQITYYEWKDAGSALFSTTLVPTSITNDVTLKMRVLSDDNRHATSTGSKVYNGILFAKINSSSTSSWQAGLKLTVHIDCSFAYLSLNGINSSIYNNQVLTIRVPDLTQSFKYPRIADTNIKNEPCHDYNDGTVNYFLEQDGYTDGSGNDFKPGLATFSTDLTIPTSEFTTLITPTANSDIQTNAPCDLSVVGVRDCQQTFRVNYKTSFSNTVVLIASVHIKFESQCLRFSENLQIWQWDTTYLANYSQGQRIGPPLDTKIFNLPFVHPTIGAITDLSAIQSLCGDLEYQISGHHSSAFTLHQPTSFGGFSTLSVQTTDSSLASATDLQFKQLYPISLRATFKEFIAENIWYEYDSQYAKPNAMDFYLQEPCFAIQYSDLNIWGDVSAIMSSAPYKVQNPVMQPPVQFFIDMNSYTDFVGASDKCGNIMFQFTGNDLNQVIQLSPFGPVEDYNQRYNLQIDAYEFSLAAQDQQLVGNYTLTVRSFLPLNQAYPDRTFQVHFEIQPCVIDSITPSQPMSEIVYTWGDSERRFTFSKFNQHPNCDYPLTYEIEVTSVLPTDTSLSSLGLQGARAPFISSFYSSARRFGIQTYDQAFFNKTYDFVIRGSLEVDYPQYETLEEVWSSPTRIKIGGQLVSIENSAPYTSEFPDTLFMSAENSYTFALPAFIDDENNQWYVEEMQFLSDDSNILSWASYDNNTRTCFFEPPLTAQGATVGINVKVTDINREGSMSTQYTFYATVVDSRGNVNIEDFSQLKLKRNGLVKRGKQPNAFVKVKNTVGEIVIDFDQIMLFEANITQWNSTDTTTSSSGGYKDIFQIEVRWSADMEGVTKEDLSLEWEVKEFTPEQITLQLTFANPKLISRRGFQDILHVKSRMLNKFMGANSNAPVNKIDQEVLLPPLSTLLLNEGQFSRLPGQAFAFSMKSIMQANLLLSIPIGGLLQYLWGMINSIQLIVLTVLFTVDMPVYTYDIYLALNQLVAFDIFQVEDTIYDPYFEFPQREALSPKFEEVGFDTPIYIIGMGSLFFIQLLWIPLNFGRLILRLFRRKLPRWCRKKCKDQIQFKGMQEEALRFSMEGCIEICINAYITLITLQVDYFRYRWEFFSTVFCIGTSIYMLALPFYLFISSYLYQKHYKTRGFGYKHFQTIYKDMRPRFKPTLYYLFFILRRYIFVISLLTFSDVAILQTATYLLGSIMTLVYMLDTQPYRENFKNKYETASEFGVLLSGYSLLSCSRASEEGARGIAETNQLTVLGLIFLANMLLIACQAQAQIKLTLRRFVNYRSYRKQIQRKHRMKIELKLRFSGMSRHEFENSKTRRKNQLRVLQDLPIIENPFVKKGQGLDFFYDWDTALTKRQMEQQRQKEAKLAEKELKEKQMLEELDKKPDADFRQQQPEQRPNIRNKFTKDVFVFDPLENAKMQDSLRERQHTFESLIKKENTDRKSKLIDQKIDSNLHEDIMLNQSLEQRETHIRQGQRLAVPSGQRSNRTLQRFQNEQKGYQLTNNSTEDAFSNGNFNNFDDKMAQKSSLISQQKEVNDEQDQSINSFRNKYDSDLREKTDPSLEQQQSGILFQIQDETDALRAKQQQQSPYGIASLSSLKHVQSHFKNPFVNKQRKSIQIQPNIYSTNNKNDLNLLSSATQKTVKNLSQSPHQQRIQTSNVSPASFTIPNQIDYVQQQIEAEEYRRLQAQRLLRISIQQRAQFDEQEAKIQQKRRQTQDKVQLFQQHRLLKARQEKQENQQSKLPNGGPDNFYKREFM